MYVLAGETQCTRMHCVGQSAMTHLLGIYRVVLATDVVLPSSANDLAILILEPVKHSKAGDEMFTIYLTASNTGARMDYASFATVSAQGFNPSVL